jgi:hypothetical protein
VPTRKETQANNTVSNIKREYPVDGTKEEVDSDDEELRALYVNLFLPLCFFFIVHETIRKG